MRRSCTLVLALIAAPVSAQQPKPIDPADVDTTCAPCRDFFQYANGGWLKRASIPGDLPAWGAFNELQERNFDALHEVLDAAAADLRTTKDADLRKLGTVYTTCMDSARAETAGVKPLAPDVARIRTVRSRNELAGAIAHLHSIGVPAAFVFRSVQDAKNSSRVIAEAHQGGLGLPDRDYYTRDDSTSRALLAKYEAHVAQLFTLAGRTKAAAANAARGVLSIEAALAHASMTPVEQRDPEAVYHLTTLADLQAGQPRLGWSGYFHAVGLGGTGELNVGQPKFVAALDSLVANAPLEAWRSYLEWQLLSNRAPTLGSRFVNESFRFNSTVLRGVKEMRPRWKRCLIRTDAAMGEILGNAYVAKHFTPEA